MTSIDFKYHAHGKGIISDLALPEFTGLGQASNSSVTIREEEILPLSVQGGEERWVVPSGFYVAWEQVGAFQVARSGQISYRRFPGSSDELIRVPLLGSVLAVALHYLGTLVMHGNAVSIGGKGIILVGAKGQGKSTLSAALIARGHLIHAEDAASVEVHPGAEAGVFRGTRQLRLWPDAIEPAFGGYLPPSRQIHELSEKRVVPLDTQEETPDRLPLECIYLLVDADDISLEPLGASEAWRMVLVHAFVSRFGTELLKGQDAARHFTTCAALTKAVRCVRLRRPRDFSRLNDVVSHIEQDLFRA